MKDVEISLSLSDMDLLKEKGISIETLRRQLQQLKEGFPRLEVESAAVPGNGILVLTPSVEEKSLNLWEEYIAKGGRAAKMVPASGAASRMFKDLFDFLNDNADKPKKESVKAFFNNIAKFAFFHRLNLVVLQLHGKSIDSLIEEGRYKDVVAALLNKEGLNYGSLPKALLQFHKTLGTSRTPVEEHLFEAARYVATKDGKAKVYFTVSEEHMAMFGMKIEQCRGFLKHQYNVEFEVDFSAQLPSTDTVAAKTDGTPYREDGKLFFRPGGHGALIENLGRIKEEVIFVKNIDNVLPCEKAENSIRYKKILGGILVGIRQLMERYYKRLGDNDVSPAELEEMLVFMRNTLCVRHDKADGMTPEEIKHYLRSKFNRPLRVCGMVRNEGEPGGGPYIVYNADMTTSPQILESSQLDMSDKKIKKIVEQATHFNPVDIVCCIKKFDGEGNFKLTDYVDVNTGFISEKSRKGVEIKALELPGLWNGAMSDWNTIFVEVPADTFNPVKTVNDLLREAHQ